MDIRPDLCVIFLTNKEFKMKSFFQIREELSAELSENSDLANLAAKHAFHHQGAEYSDDPDHHEKQAKKTLSTIKKKHGNEVSKAVQKHSSLASGHDNGTAGSSKNFHKSFVAKHLGGDHAAYKKAAKKHFFGDHPPHSTD